MRSSRVQHVVFCRCQTAELIDYTSREEIERALADANVRLTVVEDLCLLAARRDPRLLEWAASPDTALLACHPRALECLLAFAGLTAPVPAKLLNARDSAPAQLLSNLDLACDDENARVDRIAADPDWPAWFPVIDAARCTACGGCLNFCLFGVFETDDAGRPRVANPAACKTNCPACARVCPTGAIIFAKHPDPTINGAADSTTTASHADLPQLLQTDVLTALRNRSQTQAPAGPACSCSSPTSFLQKLGLSPDAINEITRQAAKADDQPPERE